MPETDTSNRLDAEPGRRRGAWMAVALMVVVAAAVFRLGAILGRGEHLARPGDATSRLMEVVEDGGGFGFLRPDRVFANWFAPGHQSVHTLLRNARPEADGAAFASAAQQLGLLAVVVAAGLLGVAVARVSSAFWGLAAAAAALGCNAALSAGASASSEAYGLLAVAAAVLAMTRAATGPRREPDRLDVPGWGAAAVCGLLLLVGTLFRHELVLLGPIFALALLVQRRPMAAVLVAALSPLYLVARTASNLWVGGAGLVNANQSKYDFGGAAAQLARQRRYAFAEDAAAWGTLMGLLVLLGVTAGLLLFRAKPVRVQAPTLSARERARGTAAPTAATARAGTPGPAAWLSAPLLLSGGILLALLVWSILTGRLDAKPRYMAMPVPLLAAGGVAAIAAASSLLTSERRAGLVGFAVAVLVAWNLTGAIATFNDKPFLRKPPPPLLELIAWLGENPASPRVFDTLAAAEFQVQLYSAPAMLDAPVDWTYIASPRLTEPPEGWPRSTLEARGAAQSAQAAVFAAEHRPGQLILWSEAGHARQKGKPRGPGLHHSDSYLRPGLRPIGEGRYRWDAQVAGGPVGALYRTAFENADYLVLEPVESAGGESGGEGASGGGAASPTLPR